MKRKKRFFGYKSKNSIIYTINIKHLKIMVHCSKTKKKRKKDTVLLVIIQNLYKFLCYKCEGRDCERVQMNKSFQKKKN